MAVWIDEEILTLQENYPVVSSTEIKKMFPKRNLTSIRVKAGRLGLRQQHRSKRICKIECCDLPVSNRNLCKGHYQRWIKGTDLNSSIKSPRSLSQCEIEECESISVSKGLCQLHYTRYSRGLDLDAPYGFSLRESEVCIIKECEEAYWVGNFCKKHYDKKRRAERWETVIRHLGGRCSKCLGIFPYYVYDAHHIDPSTKEFTISKQITSLKMELILEEANKCRLLCANCHRIEHFEMNNEESLPWL